MTTMTEATTRTLDVPGATLTYDVRPNGSTTEPPLFLIGSPMGAAGFGTLHGRFPDRTVVTYDPRGSERSTKADPTASPTRTSTPTTCIGSSGSWAGRSTSSPAAAVRSMRSRSSRSIQTTCGSWSRTSRRSLRAA